MFQKKAFQTEIENDFFLFPTWIVRTKDKLPSCNRKVQCLKPRVQWEESAEKEMLHEIELKDEQLKGHTVTIR